MPKSAGCRSTDSYPSEENLPFNSANQKTTIPTRAHLPFKKFCPTYNNFLFSMILEELLCPSPIRQVGNGGRCAFLTFHSRSPGSLATALCLILRSTAPA